MGRRSLKLQAAHLAEEIRRLKSAKVESDSPIPTAIGKSRIVAQAQYLDYLLAQDWVTSDHVNAVLESLEHNRNSQPWELSESTAKSVIAARLYLKAQEKPAPDNSVPAV